MIITLSAIKPMTRFSSQVRLIALIFALGFGGTIAKCYSQNASLKSPESVNVDYLFLKPAGQVVVQSFDVGEVGIGEEVPVLVRVMNRSTTNFEMTLKSVPGLGVRLLNGPVIIADGDNGLAEMMLKIPDTAKALEGTVGVIASLNGSIDLFLNFKFRYRDLAVFTKSFNSYSLEVSGDGLASNPLAVQLPVDVSLPDLINDCSVEADASLQAMSFQILEKEGKPCVEAKFPASLIAKSKASGKVRLKVNDKVVSEATLIVRRQTDIELLPDWVTLKYDPDKQEYRGELIVKLRSGTVPVEQIKIEVEHVDDIPIDLTIGKMAKSTGRIYLTVKGSETPKDHDLILFRIMTPLKTEEQVLSATVIR
jgi:hypothetical protein